jgi:hypothetical protein
MRVLFVMESPEYLRFYDETLRLLARRGHHVAVAVSKQREKKPVRLEGALADDPRIVLRGLVPRRTTPWRGLAKGLRGLTDFARYLHPRFAPARALRARMKRKVLPSAFRWMDLVPSVGVGGSRLLMRGLAALERTIPPSAAITRLLVDEHPDVVLVSPLVDAASDQVDLVKGARALGVPVAVCIASWDNLTNKGVFRVRPDHVIVWNEAQREEAAAYHGVARDSVLVTGAQVFDRWFERRASTTREAFCAAVGLPADRPFVLFTCSSSFISISQAEVPFVRAWIARLRAHPALAGAAVLVRPHPYNCAAWETADVSDLPHVAVWPRRAYNPVEEQVRNGFFDSLYHSAAVVGINTSAMIEAAILGKPVLSMLNDEFSGTQEGTLHFHHLLPENGGFLRLASTLDAHVPQLADVMAHPETARQDAARFVRSFLRPAGTDLPCTPILVAAVERIAAAGPRPTERAPWWSPLGWLVLAAGGLYAGTWWLVTEPGAATRELRKDLGHRRRRTAKNAARAWRLFVDRAQRGTKRLLKQVR